jgi:hypothetical protein
MKFLFGVAIGALGFWAYRTGKLATLLPNRPESVQQQFSTNPSSGAQSVVTPSATEVAGRPSEPLPREHP